MICSYDSCGSPTENRRPECTPCMSGVMVLVGIIGGIVFALIATLLFVNSLITLVNFAVWVALIFGLVYLLSIITGSALSKKLADCVRCHFGGLLFGVLGLIFSALLGITVEFAVTSILSIILVALTTFFFAYVIISALFLIKCVSR